MRRVLLLIVLCCFSTAAQTVAIRAGHLIDPATGMAATNQVILVKDGKIVEVGPQVAIPAGAQVVALGAAQGTRAGQTNFIRLLRI